MMGARVTGVDEFRSGERTISAIGGVESPPLPRRRQW